MSAESNEQNGVGTQVIAVPPREDRESPLARIGPYKIVKQIGEGAAGIVFRGEQQEPVPQTVALKLIKKDRDWRQIVARFEAERHTLSRMDHPGIAKLLGNGTQPSGQPYFVLELVEGLPLTRYCDEHHLPLERRLELFVSVCQAVQYAHQKGIIHGDLKPSNVLVSGQDDKPTPKILDLGIAKATRHEPSEKRPSLDPDVLAAKPEYLSPERVDADVPDVDTRSDVYSLGVLLYELLTDTTPLTADEIKDVSTSEILRLIREKEAPRPSNRLKESKGHLSTVAQRRHKTPKKLLEAVRDELDCVATKALHKDRAERYQTVHELARDVQRHLAGEPLEACPPSGRKLWQWAKKAPRPLLTAAVAFLLLLAALGGIGFGALEWYQAAQVRQTAQQDKKKREKAEEHETKLEHKLHTTEEAAEIRRKERDHAREAQKETEKSKDRVERILRFLKKELMSVGRPGEVSVPNAFWAGTLSEKDATARKNLTLLEAMDEAAPKVAETFANQPLSEATIREVLGFAYLNLGEATKAVDQYKRAFELREAVQGVSHADTADCRNQLAVGYRLAGRAAEAARLFNLTPHSPQEAAALAARGTTLLLEKKPAEAELKFRDSLAIRDKIQPDGWTTFETESLVGEALLNQKKYADAERLLLSGYQGMKQHEDQIPPRDQGRLTEALERLVRLYEAWGELDEALRWRKELAGAKER